MDFNAALEDCDKALSLDANYVKAYIRKGAVHFFRKEFHKAMEAYERGMKIAPDNEELKTGLQRTVLKINESANSGEVDKERAARAMQDPEIQVWQRQSSFSPLLCSVSRTAAFSEHS